MKKNSSYGGWNMNKISLILLVLITFTLSGCTKTEPDKTKTVGFAVNNWYYGLGTVDGKNLNNVDETKFSYVLNLTSDNEKLGEVNEIQPIVGKNISSKVLSNGVTKFAVKKDYIESDGYITFTTKGLTKEQIDALKPYITGVKVIMKDKREFTVKLKK